jgi:hypothetical protein
MFTYGINVMYGQIPECRSLWDFFFCSTPSSAISGIFQEQLPGLIHNLIKNTKLLITFAVFYFFIISQ